VTRGAALITAAPTGPLAGRGPPHPDVGTSLAHRLWREARIAQLHPGDRANVKRHGTSQSAHNGIRARLPSVPAVRTPRTEPEFTGQI
jgi:hypothetical protein